MEWTLTLAGFEMRTLLGLFFWISFMSAADAATYQVDLNSEAQSGTIFGPCYCGSGPYYSFSAQPGDTIDFGHVELFWQFGTAGPSTGTPSQVGYPDLLYFLAHPVVSYNSPATPPDTSGSYEFALCPRDGSSCDLVPVAFTLAYTLPAGDDSIQVGWYVLVYMPPA